jgi:hypothetical protein
VRRRLHSKPILVIGRKPFYIAGPGPCRAQKKQPDPPKPLDGPGLRTSAFSGGTGIPKARKIFRWRSVPQPEKPFFDSLQLEEYWGWGELESKTGSTEVVPRHISKTTHSKTPVKLVGERGFEPPTPWSRTRCSTRLSHSPTKQAPRIFAGSVRGILCAHGRKLDSRKL